MLDVEAKIFLELFDDSRHWIRSRWLPAYRLSIEAIASDLINDRPQKLFPVLWTKRDNAIANAGQGLLNPDIVKGMRKEFLKVIRDIYQDGSPTNFERIVGRFENWKSLGRIDRMPRLLIARAFAAIHPSLYHTTADSVSQDLAIRWFSEHTNFSIPQSRSWAARANALVVHLDQLNLFGKDKWVRNLFPWFVVEKLRAPPNSNGFRSGYRPRPESARANLTAKELAIELRHNQVQKALYGQLVHQYEAHRVGTECPTGTNGRADAVVQLTNNSCYLYEIKIAGTAAQVVREAMGQLLEYSFRAGGLEPRKLFVVGEPALDAVTEAFIVRLRAEFNLNIEYLQVILADGLET